MHSDEKRMMHCHIFDLTDDDLAHKDVKVMLAI